MIDKELREIAIESLGIEDNQDDVIEGFIYRTLYYVKWYDGEFYCVLGNRDKASFNEDDVKKFIDDNASHWVD